MRATFKEGINRLFNTEMDRAEFFKTCGIVILAVIGVTGLLSALTDAHPSRRSQPQSGGYGERRFGG